MDIVRNKTLGEVIFSDLHKNDYLNQLYKFLIQNYSIKFFGLSLPINQFNENDLLRFADLLSKSCYTEKSDFHKNIAQNIVVLLDILGNKKELNLAYASSVLKTIGNYAGLKIIQPNTLNHSFNDSIVEEAYSNAKMDSLKMPGNDDKYYLQVQKNIMESMNDSLLSYSGPTSMGKSMLMKDFINRYLEIGIKKNFAIIIPSKALINEVSSDFIRNLGNKLKLNNYTVVTSAGALALEKNSNFLFVMTPERLLYLMIKYPNIRIDTIFIDEAHKMSSDDDRSAFYYKIIEMAYNKNNNTHFVFASPNIPNPGIYTKIVTNLINQNTNQTIEIKPTIIKSGFSPVVHMQYYVDYIESTVHIYNELRNGFEFLCNMDSDGNPLKNKTIYDFLKIYGGYDTDKQSLIYCNSKDKSINYAIEYSRAITPRNIKELDDFATIIEREIHKDYLLPDLIRKGVAYHVGYLPAYIREGIEKLYKARLIKTIFCTSTLIEGVNLPADNLFVLNYNRGLGQMNEVEFRNMLGRVGRLGINVYGNVFIVRIDPSLEKEKFLNLMTSSIPNQELSIKEELTGPQKQCVVDSLCRGETKFPLHPAKQTEKSYSLMRKFGLILLKDIKKNKTSIVFKEFESVLLANCEDKSLIKQLFNEDKMVTKLDVIKERLRQESLTYDDDINTSHDQKKKLCAVMKSQKLEYPQLQNGEAKYQDVLDFLEQMSEIFNWEFYEKKSLGAKNDDGTFKYLPWYATILTQWMNGFGLNSIVKFSLDDKARRTNAKIQYMGQLIAYDSNNRIHRNVAMGDTLNVVDQIILFEIANYFLRFSTEYKAQHNINGDMDNDWYEYVEYGSTNPLTIFLQRNGFKRETAQYIKGNPRFYSTHPTLKYVIKNSIFNVVMDSYIKDDLETVKINVPEIFID